MLRAMSEEYTHRYGKTHKCSLLLPFFLDYLSASDSSFEALTLGCNKHWSELGNEVVARAVMEAVYGE